MSVRVTRGSFLDLVDLTRGVYPTSMKRLVESEPGISTSRQSRCQVPIGHWIMVPLSVRPSTRRTGVPYGRPWASWVARTTTPSPYLAWLQSARKVYRAPTAGTFLGWLISDSLCGGRAGG